MISKANSSAVASAYQNKAQDTKETKTGLNVSKQGDMSKVEKLKESINSGEYKVNLQALSEKIADSLL
ncbi:MAG: flagellar biosynthesis anti-sigma factor FlgM [Campylobacterota bacterium]|nr:flagellar biosynthesis anti-sigma factor FlgM [Campylobacterota bacterium]